MKTITTTFLSILCVVALAATPLKRVKVVVENNVTGLQDETTVFFDSTGVPAFSLFEDFSKTFNPSQWVPQVYTLSSDSVACSANAYGLFTGPVSISMGVRLDTAGYYTLAASLIEDFDPTSIVVLEDRQTGNFYNLRSATCVFYNNQAQFVIGRFVLHISFPPVISITDADCNDLGGAIHVTQEPTIAWTSCIAYDSVGLVMGSYFNINGSFTFSMLPEGNYTLAFTHGDYITNKNVFVRGHKIEVSITASTYLAAIGETIQFNSATTNASIFTWNFGDNTIITGVANPEVTYFQPGIYTVVVECSNVRGCYASDTLTVKITPATGINESAKQEIKMFGSGKTIVMENLPATNNSAWVVTNLLGARVAEGKTSGSTETIQLYGQPDGVYIVSLNGTNGRLSRKIILKN
jgi:hypothetical protein